MSPDVYQFINMMCRFIISVSYPLNDPRGEGKETCSETHDEMINMQKIMFVQGLDQLANCMFREGKEMVLERPLLILIEFGLGLVKKLRCVCASRKSRSV